MGWRKLPEELMEFVLVSLIQIEWSPFVKQVCNLRVVLDFGLLKDAKVVLVAKGTLFHLHMARWMWSFVSNAKRKTDLEKQSNTTLQKRMFYPYFSSRWKHWSLLASGTPIHLISYCMHIYLVKQNSYYDLKMNKGSFVDLSFHWQLMKNVCKDEWASTII